MNTRLNALIRGGKASVHGICAAVALCIMLSGCGGGGHSPLPPPPQPTGPGNGQASTLSCDGYPQTLGTLTQVCLLTQQDIAITPNLSVTTTAGNLLGHGRDSLSAFTLYTRVVAGATDVNTATALAKSVVVSTANGSLSETSAPVTSPETLSVDFEVFTAPTTNLTLNSSAGNMSVDNYNATLQLTPMAGNVSVQTVQGQTTVNDSAGNINVTLSGSGWTGAGMKATTDAGNVAVTRPAGYQAAFTAKSDAGNATIDSQTATSAAGTPAVVTVGTGAPITLESKIGNITVTTAQ
jgi:hypothetical protein